MKQRLKKRIAEDKAELKRLTDSPTLDEQRRETIAKIEAAEATAREKIQTIVELTQSVTGRKLQGFGSYRIQYIGSLT